MEQAVTSAIRIPSSRWSRITARARLERPTLHEWGWTAVSAGLLILSFPNFDSHLLAWISLVPLLLIIARRPSPIRALLLGWVFGTLFFYVSCYWLTYSMIQYGGVPTVVAYLLLIPVAVVVGIFPGLFAWLFALSVNRWGVMALMLAPLFWPATEWLRLVITGQLWNAIGYSQAFNSFWIQPASWGGVYAVSFLIVVVNAAIALFLLKRTPLTIVTTVLMVFFVFLTIIFSSYSNPSNGLSFPEYSSEVPSVQIVAVQPNVPMELVKSPEEMRELLERHFTLSNSALQVIPQNDRLVVWPESPMNFTYSSNKVLQQRLATFTREQRTELLLNSLEPAPADGAYNSALLINQDGRLISQYDKIRLMPFGEYVPLPQWLPGASLISGLVGEFTPGTKYTLMPINSGRHQAGVFICIEAAYPWVARRMTNEGAEFLINISNDGYLGPTAVMRQHLANAIFRAVENHRPLVRVTNTGLSAEIDAWGRIGQQTPAFSDEVRVWTVTPKADVTTFYTKYGDRFVHLCAALSAIVLIVLLARRSRLLAALRSRPTQP